VLTYLADHPDLQARLRSGVSDAELDAVLDEVLRIDDPFVANRRVATRDVVVGGREIARGDRVFLNWTAANRDERVFPEPDAYRPAEHRADNIVYGAGPHICPGRVLSTLQIRGALAALLRATTTIELDPAEAPQRYPFPSRGFDTVPVVLR